MNAGRWGWTAVVVALFIVAAAFFYKAVAPPAPPPDAERSDGVEGVEDSGPTLDLAHLTEGDMRELDALLRGEEAAPALSAARVLMASGDLAGVRLLMRASAEGFDREGAYCMAALEILRLHRWEDAWRELLLALGSEPPLDPGCQVEINDRFAIVGGNDPERALEMAGDEELAVRRWVARSLSNEPGEDVDEALVVLAGDPDPGVRRSAWMAWSGRAPGDSRPALQALAAAEPDPALKSLALDALELP